MVSLFIEMIPWDVYCCDSFIHPLHKHLLSTHYMSPVALGTWDMAVKKAKTCAFTTLTLSWKSKLNWESEIN